MWIGDVTSLAIADGCCRLTHDQVSGLFDH